MLPKDKFDVQACQELFTSSSEEDLITHLDELLPWMQDANWPVASHIVEILKRIQNPSLVPFFSKILEGTDSIWKYNILLYIDQFFFVNDILRIRDSLEPLVKQSSLADQLEEVDLIANEILSKIGSTSNE